MPRGKAQKRDHIKTTDTVKAEEQDTLSTVDQGHDFVKAGERPQVGH